MSQANIPTVHFTITLSYNEGQYPWASPLVRRDIQFSIPAVLFSGKTFADLLTDAVNEVQDAFPQAAREYAAEQEKEAAEAKEKEDAEKQ
jgi:TRAP-type C4-dicarboxylate transport system substrate-binding protein